MDTRSRVAAFTTGYILEVEEYALQSSKDIQQEILVQIVHRVQGIDRVLQVSVEDVFEGMMATREKLVKLAVRLKHRIPIHSVYTKLTSFKPEAACSNGISFQWDPLDGDGSAHALTLKQYDQINVARCAPFSTAQGVANSSSRSSDTVDRQMYFSGFIVRINYYANIKTSDPTPADVPTFMNTSRAEWCEKLQPQLLKIKNTRRAAVLAVGCSEREPADDMRIFLGYVETVVQPPTMQHYAKYIQQVQQQLEKTELVPHGWRLLAQEPHLNLLVDESTDDVLWPLVENVVLPHAIRSGGMSTRNESLKKFMIQQSVAPLALALIDVNKGSQENTTLQVAAKLQLQTFNRKLAIIVQEEQDVQALTEAFQQFKLGAKELTDADRERLDSEKQVELHRKAQEASDRLYKMDASIRYREQKYLELEKIWDHWYHKAQTLEHKLCYDFPELNEIRERIARIRREREQEAEFIESNEKKRLTEQAYSYCIHAIEQEPSHLSFRTMKAAFESRGYELVRKNK